MHLSVSTTFSAKCGFAPQIFLTSLRQCTNPSLIYIGLQASIDSWDDEILEKDPTTITVCDSSGLHLYHSSSAPSSSAIRDIRRFFAGRLEQQLMNGPPTEAGESTGVSQTTSHHL